MELFAHPPHRRRPSLDSRRVGSCIACFGACTAFTFVTACKLAKSPNVTLYTRGFSSFVTSTTAPIATGRSEPVPGRDFPRCGPAPFTAHWKSRLAYSVGGVDSDIWRYDLQGGFGPQKWASSTVFDSSAEYS